MPRIPWKRKLTNRYSDAFCLRFHYSQRISGIRVQLLEPKFVFDLTHLVIQLHFPTLFRKFQSLYKLSFQCKRNFYIRASWRDAQAPMTFWWLWDEIEFLEVIFYYKLSTALRNPLPENETYIFQFRLVRFIWQKTRSQIFQVFVISFEW